MIRRFFSRAQRIGLLFLAAATLGGFAATAWGAVSSTGEINVLDDPTGSVPTSSKPTLVLTLLVDRSQAEPGEEIKTIQIILPQGFSMTEADVRDVLIDGAPVPYEVIVTASSVRFVLANPIDNFLSSIIEILFDVRTPDIPRKEALFLVAIRNLDDQQIGEFIKPGEIDGNPNNNNDYTLRVFPNVPPPPPANVTAVADASGENDVLVTWEAVDDPDVQGYFVFRGNDPPFDVRGSGRTQFRDVNVPPGTHTYAVVAYKSRLVVSPRAEASPVLVNPDVAAPMPVPALVLSQTTSTVELRWPPSGSPDVVRYEVRFSRFGETPQLLAAIDVDPEAKEYTYVHHERLDVGRYVYAVVAVDEAENASEPREEELILLDTPFPNPFTPLGSPPFNRVTFPTRAIAAAEGDMTVRLFDLHGRQVRELFSTGGDVQWDGRGENDTLLPSGVYVYQIEIGGQFQIGTIVLIR